jgi:hypothetical protein
VSYEPAAGGLLESHTLRCASASNGARHACPVHPPKCAGRESNPHALRHGYLRPAWLPVTPPARGADDGPRTRDLRHGEATLCRLSYIHSEPPRGIEPRTSFVPGTRSCQLSYGGILCRPATLLSCRGGAGTRRGAEGAEIRPASGTVACPEPLTRIERVPAAYEAVALPTELQGPRWDTRLRTWKLPNQSRVGLPVPLCPIAWRRRESNPLQQRLQGAPAP